MLLSNLFSYQNCCCAVFVFFFLFFCFCFCCCCCCCCCFYWDPSLAVIKTATLLTPSSVYMSRTPFYTSHTLMTWYYDFMLDVRVSVRTSVRQSVSRSPSVHPSVFRFRMITWVNINGFSSNLVCALILWRSGLGLLMGKFRQFLWSYLPATR